MARKPKVIEVPGDATPTPAQPVAEATPQPQAATTNTQDVIGGYPVLERRAGWVRLPHGWFQE